MEKTKRGSMAAKIKVFVALSTVLVVLILCAISIQKMGGEIRTQIDEIAEYQLKYVVATIEGFVDMRMEIIDTLSFAESARKADVVALDSVFYKILSEDPFSSAVYIALDEDGSIYGYQRNQDRITNLSLKTGYDARKESWYKKALESKLAVFCDPYYEPLLEAFIMSVTRKIVDDQGNIVGVVGLDIYLEEMSRFVGDLKFGENGYAFLTNSEGIILGHPNINILGKNITEINTQSGAEDDVAKEVLRSRKGKGKLFFDNVTKIFYFDSLDSVSWNIALSIPEAEIVAPVRNATYLMLLAGVVLTVFSVAIISRFATRLTRPLLEVAIKLEDIASGAGDLTQRIEVKSNDEAGRVARAFNSIVEKLGGIMGDIAQVAENVNKSSQELSNATNQQADVMNEIALSVADSARGISEQNNSIIVTRESTLQLSSAIEQIAKGAAETAESVNNAFALSTKMIEMTELSSKAIDNINLKTRSNAEFAKEGQEAVGNVVFAMKNIEVGVAESVESFQSLEVNSQEVEEVVKIINEISDQINLLALNAAIEAARAGEYGRGFAVVAEEIRVLANKTRESTNEISSILETIGLSVEQASKVVEHTSVQIVEGTSVTNTAAMILEEISKSAESVQESVLEIIELTEKINKGSGSIGNLMTSLATITEQSSAATEEINANSLELTRAVDLIATISDENAASSEEVSAAIEEQSATIEEMAANANSLANLSHQLKQVIDQFKY